jgi:hypothetical protein
VFTGVSAAEAICAFLVVSTHFHNRIIGRCLVGKTSGGSQCTLCNLASCVSYYIIAGKHTGWFYKQ